MKPEHSPAKLGVTESFLEYLDLIQKEFRAGREATPDKGPTDDLMLSTICRLEQSHQFSDLARATEAIRCKNEDIHVIGEWEGSVQCYFRLSGLYQAVLMETPFEIIEESQKYLRTFQADKLTITYLAPLEFVRFSESVLSFAAFEIRRYSRAELDTLLHNPARKVFYPYAYIDTAALCPYWFLVVNEKIPARWSEREIDISGRVRPSYSEYPPAVQRALRCLALYNWGLVDFQEPERPEGLFPREYGRWASPFRPEIPFVLPLSSLPIDPPAAAPRLELLADGDEDPSTREPSIWLDNADTRSFRNHIAHCSLLIEKLRPYGPHWGFLETALDFLLKGFLSEGLEQLLWHITAIEAAVGPGEGGTRRLQSRFARVIGRSESEQRHESKTFQRLYNVRNEFVHGNADLKNKEVLRGHLSEARDRARVIVLWLLNYLAHTAEHFPPNQPAVPKRDELLRPLDMDSASLIRAPGLLQSLPASFPSVPDWLKETGGGSV